MAGTTASRQPPYKDAGGPGRGRPILVIEDEPDFRTMYERLFRRLHYDVIAADIGTDGLRAAESVPVCLVVTDLKLPDMDGIALIRALRARADPPPIIVVSGLTSGETRRDALASGATAYLTKPFSVSALTALIQEVLSDGHEGS